MLVLGLLLVELGLLVVLSLSSFLLFDQLHLLLGVHVLLDQLAIEEDYDAGYVIDVLRALLHTLGQVMK